MSALSELSNISSRQEQSSLGVSNGANVESSKLKAETLAGDVLGIMKKSGDIVQTDNDLSVGFAKRNAVSNLTERNKEIAVVLSDDTPDTDFRQQQKAVESIHQKYGAPEFDNQDADRAFVDMYHVKGSEEVANIKGKLETKAVKQDAGYMEESIKDSASWLITDGQMTPEIKKTLLNMAESTHGYYSKDEAELDIVTMQSQNVTATYNPEDYVSQGGKISKEELTAQVVKDLGEYVTLDKKGGLSYTTDNTAINSLIEKTLSGKQKEVQAVANKNYSEYNKQIMAYADTRLSKFIAGTDSAGNLYTFDTDPVAYEKAIRTKYEEIDNITLEKVMKKYGDAHRPSSSGSKVSLAKFDELIRDANSFVKIGKKVPPEILKQIETYGVNSKHMGLTSSQVDKIYTATTKLNEEVIKVSSSNDMVSASVNQNSSAEDLANINSLSKTGTVVEIINEDGTKKKVPVGGSYIKDSLRRNIEVLGSNIRNIPLDQLDKDKDGNEFNVGKKAFRDNVLLSKNYGTAFGTEPVEFPHYRAATEKMSEDFKTVDDALKSIDFFRIELRDDASLSYKVAVNAELKAILEKTYVGKNGEPLSDIEQDVQRLVTFNDRRKKFINNIDAKSDYAANVKIVKEAVEEMKIGGLTFGTILNSKVSNATKSSIVTYLTRNGIINQGEEKIVEAMKNLNTNHVGTWSPAMFSSKDVTIIMNDGQDDTALEKEIFRHLATIDGYDIGDVIISSEYKTYIAVGTGQTVTGWVQIITTDKGFPLFQTTQADVVVNSNSKDIQDKQDAKDKASIKSEINNILNR